MFAICQEFATELERARKKFPPMVSAHEGYGVIAEEFDELWEIIKQKQTERDYAAMRKETVQLGAMVLALTAITGICAIGSPRMWTNKAYPRPIYLGIFTYIAPLFNRVRFEMVAYYNENDKFAAQWLRNLIAKGLIAPGDVDERSIVDVRPDDLVGYRQCHFFAGIGGWSHALRLAGWPDGAPVWTGSCPCQPLSVAGQQRGHADERHLWPAFFELIAECKPTTVFGEQVASKDGREWLAGVRANLEAVGFACGAADLCAASVSAPHRRQRLYWVADTPELLGNGRHDHARGDREGGGEVSEFGERRNDGGVADANGGNSRAEREQRGGEQRQQPQDGGDREAVGVSASAGRCGRDALEKRGFSEFGRSSSWRDHDIIAGRRVKPGVRLLAHGVPGRMGKLRGFGNAIVPPLAAEFISAFLEAA